MKSYIEKRKPIRMSFVCEKKLNDKIIEKSMREKLAISEIVREALELYFDKELPKE